MSGPGISSFSASVDTSVHVAAYDTSGSGIQRISGGDFFFLHVQDLCTVTSNYYCEESATSSKIFTYYPLIFKQMTDNNDGSYDVTYQIKRDGTVSVDIILAKNGGLYGEYFNNAFLDGIPAIKRIDPNVDFDWGTDLITNEAADFVSVRWYGKIRAPTTEEYTFILHADDGIRLYIDGVLVIDRWDSCCADMTATLSFV